MPTYAFRCLKCQKVIEITCSIKESDTLDPQCFEEGCNGQPTKQVFEPLGFSLKGSGWARDGYSSKK